SRPSTSSTRRAGSRGGRTASSRTSCSGSSSSAPRARSAPHRPAATVVAMPGFRGAVTPQEKIERPADPAVRRANLRRIARLFREYRLKLAVVCALIVVSAGLGIVSPFLLRGILDTALPNQNMRLLSLLAGGMIAISIVTGAIGVFQSYLSTQVGQSVMHDLRTQVYRHLQRLSLAFFTKTRTGEVQSRIANDIGGVDNVLTSTATSVMSTVTTVIATVIAMFLLSWQLALFALGLLP